jgi:hypothetical protein
MRRSKPRPVALDLKSLSGRQDVFRLSGAEKRDPGVELWFASGPAELRAIAHEWFARMRRCGSDVRELIHDGCPVACVGDAAFGYVNSFKRHVNVGFFHGAALDDPAGLLEGSGRQMRHVKVVPCGALDSDALGALIDAAYLDVKARLGGAAP